MKNCVFACLFFLLTCTLSAQEKQICIAFYNQENLFDTLDDPIRKDEEFTPTGTYNWTSERYANKLQNMARVIVAMNQGKGPDALGMCEVENQVVLQDLTAQLRKSGLDYHIVWFESPDERGIDNALLYRPDKFQLLDSRIYLIDTAGLNGDRTRGIVLANFKLSNKGNLAILVNHWPSRREGEKESEYKRHFVAARLKTICDSLHKTNDDLAILAMGDFNDYPNNSSIREIMKGKKVPKEVKENDFYNPMYALMEAGKGSYHFRGEWNFLDQFLLNEELLEKGNRITYVTNSTNVFNQDWMLEPEGKYKGNPLRTFGGKKYLNGYSDHLPVYLYLKLK